MTSHFDKLSEEQLQAMEASAPLLVAEVRELRALVLELSLEYVPKSIITEAVHTISRATRLAICTLLEHAANDPTYFDQKHGQQLLHMVAMLRKE